MVSVGSKYGRQVGELSVLHEISRLRLSAPVDELADEAMEKAVRLFGLSRFALLLRQQEGGDRLASVCGLRDRGDLMERLGEVDPRRFSHPLGDDGELGLLFMERSRAIQEDELRLYRIFSRHLEEGLQRARIVRERERAEEELRASEQRYRSLVENANEMIAVIQDGMVRYANPTALEGSGYSPEEVRGKSFLEFIHSDDRQTVAERHQKRLRGEDVPAVYEFRFVDKNGGVRWVSLSAARITWEGQPATLNFLTDVTERKQAEDALRKSEEEFRMLFEQMKEAVYVASSDGTIQRVNQAGLDLFGYSREEFEGADVRMLYADSDQRPHVVQQIERQGALLDFNLRMRKKGGEVMDCVITSGILRAPDGVSAGYLTLVRDVTEVRQLEAERGELEQRAQMTSRLATVGEMAAGIAHEINNPLTSVIGFAQLLAQGDMPDELKEYAKMISDGGERVASIVRRLLTFARRQKPQRSYVDVNEIVDTSLQLRAYELKTNNIEVVRRLDPELPWTMADAGQLQQVFLNLIINAETAMRATHNGGRLTVSSRRKGESICVSFRDNGHGISKADLEKVFDPFFSTRGVREGTGLGLSICHGIVSEHRGRIYARSKPGRGSTFHVELPIEVEQRQLELSERERQDAQNEVHGKVLVVDDEPPILQFLGQVLREEGHEVHTTESAEEALERIQNERYSLILVDIKLPGMSGSELYNRVRQMARSLAQRVVFITGDLMSDDTRSFVSRVKVPCITKPFNAEGVKREVRRLLS